MRPETRLESAVFQLTPTRTRCDLVVLANGRKEKIASGLLNPFIAHLKVAQEQIAKGGYSITLEPDSENDASWFTRGTVERFVRFVSTPEVLERVTTIESEILQIEDAIAVQGNDTLGLRSVEDHNGKSVDCMEGSKTYFDPDADMALVPYKAGTQPTPPLQNNGATQEENSKAQLLRVLETRKTVLRKEQAMAFARAVAAGFDIDNLVYLITFAESFGASRLMKACTQFIGLWKQKHETGQWIEVEPEAMSARSEFPPFNPSGIMFMGDNMKQSMETMSVSNGDANGEDASKADQRTSQHSGAPHEFFHGGPYQSAYPPWAMHPPYSMQGMPYYPGMNPYYPPPYPPMDDIRHHHSERRVSKKHSSNSKDSETSDDESEQSGSERETSYEHRSHKKDKRTCKKKPSVVVIRNINVTSKKHGSSESGSQTGSDVVSEDSDDPHTKSRKKKNKSSSSKKKDARKIILEPAGEYNNDEMSYEQDGGQGNWNVFQSFLLRADEKTRENDADLFASEKEPPPARRKESTGIDDSILLAERDSAGANEPNTIGFNGENGRIRPRQMLSGDELMMSGEGDGVASDGIKEIEAGDARYRIGASDDFMIYGQESSMDRGSSLDPLAETQYKKKVEKGARSMADESFMIPLRFTSEDNLGPESHPVIDIDVELPSTVKKISDAKAGGQLFYEPDELMPERGCEDISFGYDPAMDYNSQMQSQPATMVQNAHMEEAALSNVDEVKKPEKDKRLRSSQESLDKRRKDASVRRLSSSKGPMTDAQKRAQNLRAYKADLQKAKKEQEEEQIKRLEKLKLERQKRIAARSSTSSASTTPQQPKVKPAPKVSPSTHKSSKFSDAEPASSSPLRKLPARTTPGTDPPKPAKASQLNDNKNAVSKSTSLLTDMKEKSGRAGSSSERLKKLAEPKTSGLTDHPPNSKSASVNHLRRRSMPQDTQTKKISAIMQLDQSKSATLPELKVKSPQAPALVKNAVVAKEKKEVSPGDKAPTTESAGVKKTSGSISRMNSSDDSVVVEKTVVMLENEVVSTPPVIPHSGTNAANGISSDDRTEKPIPELESTAIRGPSSPLILPDSQSPDSESPVTNRSDDQGNAYEVVTDCRKDEPERPALTAVEKPYQAPFARVTSLENASDYGPLPVQESESLVHANSIKARVPEPVYTVSVEGNEVNEKYRSKEPKGIRKLLKFGRKSHASSLTEGAMDSDASSVDEAPARDGSMLKNLISQEDSGTSSKASRSFSLLSPFRSKHKVIVL